jgi:long-chain acyl-CoA synthetase
MVGIKRYSDTGTAIKDSIRNGKGETWPQVLKYNYEKFGNRHTAIRLKHYGIWQSITWQDYFIQVKYLALGLLAIGFKSGDKLLIVGDNAPQWCYAELASQANHGISTGVYSDSSASEIAYIANNSEAAFIMAEDQEQVDKLLQIKNKLPHLKKIIFWRYKGLSDYKDLQLIGIKQVLRNGHEYEKKHPGVFEKNIDTGKAEDVCAIIYTSGVKDKPKGAVHTYASLMSGAENMLSIDPLHEKDNLACLLPPVWILEQIISIGCHLLSASILNFGEAVETQQQDLREIGPDLICYNARQWENQTSIVRTKIQGADIIKRLAYRLFMPIGYKAADAEFKQEKLGIWSKVIYSIANLFLFRPVRDSLGLPHTRICYTSGVTLSPDTFRFYHALGIPLKNIYGTTEGGILSIAASDNIQPETVGAVVPGAEVGITENGEIVYRQTGMFTCYYNAPKETSQVVKDGWFYSLDIGCLTDDGQMVFVDRKDDIVKLACGETLSPQLLESRLKFSPYIKDAWVNAKTDGSIVAAVIIIDFSNVGKWAGKNKISYTTFSDLSQKNEVYDLIRQHIVQINKEVPSDCQINKYVNLHREFDPDEGELTKDRKIRRAFLKERYDSLIKAIFTGKHKAEITVQIQYSAGRKNRAKTTVAIKDVKEGNQ